MQPTRRDFVAGFAACLALCFAPWERFCAGLKTLLARVYAETSAKAAALEDLLIRAAEMVARQGAPVTHYFMNPIDFAAIGGELSA